MRAFVFSLEAFLALLLAFSFLLLLQPPSFSSRIADVYSYQLAQDVAGITLQRYPAELAAFSKGDPAAARPLQSAFEELLLAVGAYCLEVESNGRELDVRCGNSSTESFVARRVFWDGERFVEAAFTLKR